MNIVPSTQAVTSLHHAGLWDHSHDLTLITPRALQFAREVAQTAVAQNLPDTRGLTQAISAHPQDSTYEAVLARAKGSYLAAELVDCGWHVADALLFFGHLGRDVVHASKGRDFATASWKNLCKPCRAHSKPGSYEKQAGCKDQKCGTVSPRLYPPPRLADKQYVSITHAQRAAFIAVDVDIPGRPGGSINDVHPQVLALLNKMTAHGFAPNLGGINPQTGTCQFIWYIDPVYSDGDPTKPNRPMRFLKALQSDLNLLIGGDKSFSHRFMRNPFYIGPDVKAYKWNAWHGGIYQMRHLSLEVARLDGTVTTGIVPPKQTRPVKTGRDLIEQAKANREAAAQWTQYAKELGSMSIKALEALEANDPTYINGVKLCYTNNGQTIARDETAFRHALKTASRMRKNGERLSDNKIIDAYTHAYNTAQSQTRDGRTPDMPPQRDLQTMARRVRAYTTHNTPTSTPTKDIGTTNYVTPQERSVLSTFGKRGGVESSKRKWANPDSELAQRSLAPLHKANQQRAYNTDENKGRILAYIAQQRREGYDPTTREIATDLNLSVRRVQALRKDLGINSKRGRPPKKN